MRKSTTRFYCLLLISFLLRSVPVSAQVATVMIGSQEWTTKNLETSHFKNGDPIRQATTSNEWLVGIISKEPIWCYYEYNSENGKKYGKLYSWYALNDPRGLAPAGYHIPSDAEWTKLENFLGGRKTAGAKLAITDPRGPANNLSGFTGLPSGLLFKQDDFQGMGFMTAWWTSSFDSPKAIWTRMLSFSGEIERMQVDGLFGLAVRCVKDAPAPIKTTKPVKPKPVTTKPVVKKTVPLKPTKPLVSPSKPVVAKTEPVKILTSGKFTDPRDGGETYQTINIGNQTWMAENLNTKSFRNGEAIPQAMTKAEWTKASDEKTAAWCYYDFDPKNEDYGKLYNWFAVNDARGLAATGWHVPVQKEYITLVSGLGYYSQALIKMRSESGWSVNTSGSNESGFTALPAGFCYYNADFVGKGTRAFFWNASEEPFKKDKAQYTAIWYHPDLSAWSLSLENTPFDKTSGMSVRCVKD